MRRKKKEKQPARVLFPPLCDFWSFLMCFVPIIATTSGWVVNLSSSLPLMSRSFSMLFHFFLIQLFLVSDSPLVWISVARERKLLCGQKEILIKKTNECVFSEKSCLQHIFIRSALIFCKKTRILVHLKRSENLRRIMVK